MSLKSSRKLFNSHLVEYVSNNMDWTKTKKYTQKMCEFIVNSDVINDNTNKGVMNFFETLVSGFKLFDRYSVNFNEKDITKYKTYEEFFGEIEKYISTFSSVKIRNMIKVDGKINPGENLGLFGEYNIVKIRDFKDASSYSGYCSWCVTKMESTFLSYTRGHRQFYFALQTDYEKIPMIPVSTETPPLDKYGLSMLAISVAPDGTNEVTTRWNHQYNNSTILSNDFTTLNYLFNIDDCKKIIKPKIKENKDDFDQQLIISNLRLKLGVSYKNIFDSVFIPQNGFSIITLGGGKENFFNIETKEIISDIWFDYVYNFDVRDNKLFCLVQKNNKKNIINSSGKLIGDFWFDNITMTPSMKFFIVESKFLLKPGISTKMIEQYNTMDFNGNIINDTWFSSISNISSTFRKVIINNNNEYIDINGKIVIRK